MSELANIAVNDISPLLQDGEYILNDELNIISTMELQRSTYNNIDDSFDKYSNMLLDIWKDNKLVISNYNRIFIKYYGSVKVFRGLT